MSSSESLTIGDGCWRAAKTSVSIGPSQSGPRVLLATPRTTGLPDFAPVRKARGPRGTKAHTGAHRAPGDGHGACFLLRKRVRLGDALLRAGRQPHAGSPGRPRRERGAGDPRLSGDLEGPAQPGIAGTVGHDAPQARRGVPRTSESHSQPTMWLKPSATFAGFRCRDTQEAMPELWAELHQSLGTAHLRAAQQDRPDNIEQAIVCFERATEVFARASFPAASGAIQNELGLAYLERIRGDRAENVEAAIGCLDSSLQLSTRVESPLDWATTCHNLGNAYRHRLRGDRAQTSSRRSVFSFEPWKSATAQRHQSTGRRP